MLSAWHVSHLPVWVEGQAQPVQVIDRVVVSWSELVVEGFLLTPTFFRTLFVPADASFRMTDFGMVVAGRADFVHKTRRWRRETMKRQQGYYNRPVLDCSGRSWGPLKDVLFNESSLRVTHLVVSRGVLGDLLSGALVVAREDVVDLSVQGIKIRSSGAFLSMK